MQSTLNDVIKKLNNNTQTMTDASNPVGQIIKILNVHYDALAWIKKSTDKLRVDVQEIGSSFQSNPHRAMLSRDASYY
jgi:hypothetical protein